MVVHRGRLERVPPGFMLMAPARLWPLVTTPDLEPLGQTAAAGRAVRPAAHRRPDESLGSFARRRFGRETFERIVQPLVGGIYTADPEKLSLRATLPRFVEMERRWGSLIRAARHERTDGDAEGSGARYGLFVAPRDGMTSLVQAIAARLPKRFGAAQRAGRERRAIAQRRVDAATGGRQVRAATAVWIATE